MATDEEPPGPLDLSSSILSNDSSFATDGQLANATLSYAALGESFSAIAMVAAPSANGNGRHARNSDVSEPAGSSRRAKPGGSHEDGGAHVEGSSPNHNLAFLRQTGNALTRAFRRRHYPDATTREWNDWRWQSRHRIRTLQQLESMLRLSDEEREALVQGGTMLPMGISPYYMSLLDPDDPWHPLRRTVVPTLNEFVRTAGEADDPLGEDSHSPVPGLVHRYPDRVLLLPLDFCSTYCRYCTRSRVVGHGELMPQESRLMAAFDYLRRTPQIRDVLISGGDALALGDDKLDWILRNLREIPNIEFIRIGTKMPAVLPQRITRELCRVLRKYHPVWMSVHFIHPDECTPEAAQACARLADAGIPLGSQTVLLKDVNDNVDTIRELMHKLLLMRVRPYYLYQCDPISGSSHFRTPVAKGLEIIEGLRGHTTGYAVPTYVIDAPGGGGKIPLQPESVVGRDGDWIVLRNYEGCEYRYHDPV
jgi:lysine 2,3-aminomutase